MGESATEMDVMDSAKDSRGLDLGLKKTNGLRLGWIEVETLVQEPVVNPRSARFNFSNLMCERRHVCTYIQLSVISVLMKGYTIAGI